jgi:hypothetical protein
MPTRTRRCKGRFVRRLTQATEERFLGKAVDESPEPEDRPALVDFARGVQSDSDTSSRNGTAGQAGGESLFTLGGLILSLLSRRFIPLPLRTAFRDRRALNRPRDWVEEGLS